MRKARLIADMSTDDMAADIGRTRRTISNYESDSTTAPLLVLRQYAMRTGVPLRWLERGESGDPDKTPVNSPVTDQYHAASGLLAA